MDNFVNLQHPTKIVKIRAFFEFLTKFQYWFLIVLINLVLIIILTFFDWTKNKKVNECWSLKKVNMQIIFSSRIIPDTIERYYTQFLLPKNWQTWTAKIWYKMYILRKNFKCHLKSKIQVFNSSIWNTKKSKNARLFTSIWFTDSVWHSFEWNLYLRLNSKNSNASIMMGMSSFWPKLL